MRMPVGQMGRESWEEVIPHRDDFEVTGFQIFRNHLAVDGRKNDLRQSLIHPWLGDEEHYVDFGETAYVAVMDQIPDLDSEVLQYRFWSFTIPRSVYAYNMRTKVKLLLKREEVSGGFESDDYISERLYAPARDGVRVPISVVYRKGLKKDGSNLLLIEAYGSYGQASEATFSIPRLSLLDRGFVYAIAHVRGGGDLGLRWHEDGKLLKKKNTFNDFIDVAEFLIAQKYTSRQKLFATGRSAGGTLMGVVANIRPDLFRGIIADVPGVGILDGDPDMEFGDPGNEEHYRYMLSYSPYDNVTAKHYPSMLVTTALNDTSVPYWSPAKWVAKLRELKTDSNLLILKTDMEGGHSAEPRRYKEWRNTAFCYAFLLDLAGIRE
jgi:oligopeptidase B